MMQNNFRHAMIYRIIYWIMCLLKLELVKNVSLSSFHISTTTRQHFISSNVFFFLNFFTIIDNIWYFHNAPHCGVINMEEAQLSLNLLIQFNPGCPRLKSPEKDKRNQCLISFVSTLLFSGLNLTRSECRQVSKRSLQL